MREQEISGNEHLLGKEKLKKADWQVREQGVRGNEHLHGKEKLKKRDWLVRVTRT